MTKYQTSDLVLVYFPFVQSDAGKQRPALVLLDAGDADILVARVTTQDYHSRYDVRIEDWQDAGLKAPSVVRMHKLATLEKKLVRRRLGSLALPDRRRIATILRDQWGNW
jgi:mRNA interferase MazF